MCSFLLRVRLYVTVLGRRLFVAVLYYCSYAPTVSVLLAG